jgi:hypothetical protein
VPVLKSELETEIEQDVVDDAALLGIPSLKLNLRGNRGWPDRIFLIPGGRPLFIEFKRGDEEPDPLQAHRHDVLRKLGYDIEVHHVREEALAAIRQARDRAHPRRPKRGARSA